MAMITDAFVGKCVEALMKLAKEEFVMVLGIKEDLQRLQKKMEKIKNVLHDAERRRIDDETIQSWLSELKDVLYDADDIIDLCSINGPQMLAGAQHQGTVQHQLPSTSSSTSRVRSRFPNLLWCCTSAASIPFRHEIGKEIEKITSRLEEIFKDKQQFTLDPSIPVVVSETRANLRETTSLPPPNVVGREMEDATNKLVGWLKEDKESRLHNVYAIVGTGGIGKTTLAQKIYNHQYVKSTFQFTSWICVSQHYSPIELLKQLIREAGGNHGIAQSKEELIRLLYTTTSGKRFLLVLDDVWQADVWGDLLQSPLQNGGPGSKILVTTRNNYVAESMRASHRYQVNKLPISDGWKLLSTSVFATESDADMQGLQDIGIKILEKCDGLPLAIKVVAGVLKTGNKSRWEWEKVCSSYAWSIKGDLPEEVRGALYLSYEVLPSPLKQCFLHFSVEPEDYLFYRDDLIRYWVSEGFVMEQKGLLLEDIAEDYYTELINRNLLLMDLRYADNSRCKMHDVVRSLAIFLARDESCYIDSGGSSTKLFTKIRRLGTEGKLESLDNLERLRSLISWHQPYVIMEDLIDKLRHLRVLDLRDSSIDSIPSSIKDLQHLRHLDLDRTDIRELPESIGCLSFLLILNLSGCEYLHALPKSITQLRNLRRLGIKDTPLSHIPAGIGKLEHLNDLEGYVVGDSQESREHGCSLDELQSLSQIRRILIDKLERASTSGSSIRPLKDKKYLKELKLKCTFGRAAEDSMRIEMIFEDLCPSPSLQSMELYNFPGVKFPGWISMLPNLTDLRLYNCFDYCTQLPALGRLLQLRVLEIIGAAAVTSIGVECLLDCKQGTAFPKLEELVLKELPNLEEWRWDIVEAAAAASGGGANTNIIRQLLPRLKKLKIKNCPKLRALPDGLLHDSALEELYLDGAKSVIGVNSLLSLEKLSVKSCRSLERISNLPSLKELRITESCRPLVSIENVNTLQRLTLQEYLEECFPECLLGLIRNSVTFNLTCNERLGIKCREGGEYWSLLQHIQQVEVNIDKIGIKCFVAKMVNAAAMSFIRGAFHQTGGEQRG